MANIGLCVVFVVLLSSATSALEGTVDASVSVDAKLSVAGLADRRLRIPLIKTILSPCKCRYTLGQTLIGDILVAKKINSLVWTEPQNAQLKLNYNGPILGFVDITVTQTTSALGEAYVLVGGIGQTLITIVVEAPATLRLDYEARFYGRGGVLLSN